MMKKIIAIATVLAMALVLTACEPATLSVDFEETAAHAVAKGGADGSSVGDITIEKGSGLCINHIVNKGSFHVQATDKSGAVVFDKDITDNIADMVPVDGELHIVIDAKGADGTIDIIAYDIAAQAQADATLDDTLKEIGLESLSSASSDAAK